MSEGERLKCVDVYVEQCMKVKSMKEYVEHCLKVKCVDVCRTLYESKVYEGEK